MNRIEQSKSRAFVPRGVLSVKIFSIVLAGLLLVGTVPATHSYPSTQANFNNIWSAVQEFWNSLEFFKSRQRQQNATALEVVDSTSDYAVVEITEEKLEKLKNHPECRSIYVSEYLPTFNSDVIGKCERAIKQYEQKQLFDKYVEQLCLNPAATSLTRKQLGEIQLRLRKYALMFPQSNIEVSSSDIDGLYGVKTCQIIANYQIISKFDVVNGIADIAVYNDLLATIPLNELELASVDWQPVIQRVSVVKKQNPSKVTPIAKSNFKLPKNPFKRIAFCLRNNHIKQCDYSARRFDLAKADINQR